MHVQKEASGAARGATRRARPRETTTVRFLCRHDNNDNLTSPVSQCAKIWRGNIVCLEKMDESGCFYHELLIQKEEKAVVTASCRMR
ncbi:hypothetical protein JOB18_008934 [Solea senegalensis]|uniref:Uncharacterized protein n=1 Tax=Solea senegalensis TaxID=28829 RepID=A0AAV6QVD7_SOLSE|nr:hypothetical protein JOB18_010062 [Solea senegalensis]KAG7524223.1 hypothetical protein JOB18_008934 [Solea senegalensis]